jgi:hypothetical protein
MSDLATDVNTSNYNDFIVMMTYFAVQSIGGGIS